jgi:replicative DNA helicase
MIFNRVKKEADLGMQGRNKGLDMGLPKLGKAVNYVQRGRYDLIAGKTSAGKTAFVDQCYLLAPFDDYLRLRETEDIKVSWLYFSLEISPEAKFAKLAAREIKNRYDVSCSMAEILSLGDHKLSSEKREMLDSCSDYFEELEKHLHIYDMYDTSDSIDEKIGEFMSQHGELTEEEGQKVFKPHHPNHYFIIIVDNVNLLTRTKEQFSKKEAIDSLSRAMIWYRNVCKATPVMLQQYNASIVDPKRLSMKMFEPIVDDLEDSKFTSKDCNTYFSVFDPSEMGLKESAGGYDLNKLGNKFRQIKVHKNRDGNRDWRVGTGFIGATGEFFELPSAGAMSSADYVNTLNQIDNG